MAFWDHQLNVSLVWAYSRHSSNGLDCLGRNIHAPSLTHVQLLQPHELQSTRLFCPWDFPGKSTGMSCHFLLQGTFLTQGSYPLSSLSCIDCVKCSASCRASSDLEVTQYLCKGAMLQMGPGCLYWLSPEGCPISNWSWWDQQQNFC